MDTTEKDQDPLVDPITQARDFIRRNPGATEKEIQNALALPNLTVAREIIKEARKSEQKLQANLIKEDTAAEDAPAIEIEKKLFLKTESGISHLLRFVKEGKRNVVFELDDQNLKVVRV